ncbi:acetyltransferase [Limnohabitans sp.]|uniref:acetyltransferase n=1 Tax=Limnohabitans sp. TaxID=1907725 RepID=UPI0031FD011F
MSQPLIIFGTGTLARLAHYYAVREMGLEVKAFAVDATRLNTDTCCDSPVVSWDQCLDIYPPRDVSMYVAVGYREMRQREALFDRVQSAGYSLKNIISKSAFVAETVWMGQNNFIMPGVVIDPGVSMGANNVIWSNATICHDTIIGKHNFVASNVTIGGEVTVGDRCFLGFSSTVVQQCCLGDDVLLAAQSLLLEDADSLSRHQGVPAVKVGVISQSAGVCIK